MPPSCSSPSSGFPPPSAYSYRCRPSSPHGRGCPPHGASPSSIILVLIALAARLISDRIPWQKFFITNTLALAIGSTAIFVIGKAFFCRPAATLETDFALLPKFLFGGALLSLPVCFLTYSVKDIIEGLLFQSIDDTVAPSEE